MLCYFLCCFSIECRPLVDVFLCCVLLFAGWSWTIVSTNTNVARDLSVCSWCLFVNVGIISDIVSQFGSEIIGFLKDIRIFAKHKGKLRCFTKDDFRREPWFSTRQNNKNTLVVLWNNMISTQHIAFNKKTWLSYFCHAFFPILLNVYFTFWIRPISFVEKYDFIETLLCSFGKVWFSYKQQRLW